MDKRLTAEIERKTDEPYLERNGSDGDAVADWLEADKEVQNQREKTSSKRTKIRIKERS